MGYTKHDFGNRKYPTLENQNNKNTADGRSWKIKCEWGTEAGHRYPPSRRSRNVDFPANLSSIHLFQALHILMKLPFFYRLYNFTSEGLLDRLAQWTFMCGEKGSWKMSQFLGQQHEYQNQINSSDRTFSSENVACLRMSFSALGVLVGRYASETGVDSSKKRLKLICRSSLMALAALARTFLSNQFFPIHRDFWHSDTWFKRIWFRTLIE